MSGEQATLIIGALKAAFPRQPVQEETVRIYAAFLTDYEYGTAERAVRTLIARSRFFPTIAEIREAVAEAALNLPNELEAWELVQEIVWWQPTRATCDRCSGTGFVDPERETVCGPCRGNGMVAVDERPQLAAEVQRALDYIGGVWAVRDSDELGVLRAQFRDAYRQSRAQAVIGRMLNAPQINAAPGVPIPELRGVPA